MKLLKALVVATVLLASQAFAAWPTKPITIIVPFPPGGATDVIARSYLQAELQDALKVPVVITNIAGSGAGPAANHILSEKNDNNIFLLSDVDFIAGQVNNANPLYKKFTPLTVINTTPLILYGSSKNNNIIQRFKGEILTKSTVNVGYVGTSYAWVTQVKSPTTFNLIPYKGGAQMSLEVQGGHLEYGVASAGGIWNSIYVDKTLQPLMITSPERSPSFPGVPTADELGFKGPHSYQWFAFWSKSDLDAEAQRTFTTAVRTIVAKSEKIQALSKTGFKNVNYTQAETQKFMDAEIKKYENLTISKQNK